MKINTHLRSPLQIHTVLPRHQTGKSQVVLGGGTKGEGQDRVAGDQLGRSAFHAVFHKANRSGTNLATLCNLRGKKKKTKKTSLTVEAYYPTQNQVSYM